ncbi:MAG: ribokinase [Thermoguttaceae bacterium]|nr:ribokinase [Thermoguttaceae bacterium]
MASQIIILGSVNTDLVIRGPRLPVPGETVIGGEFYQAHGGKGANQAVAAARAAREEVTFIAAVGDDDFGRQAREQFARERLDCQFLKVVRKTPTGVALIVVDHKGENSITVASGANSFLEPADIDAVPDEVFRSAKVFLTCLESPLDTVLRGLVRAKGFGLLTILNPAPANPEICRGEMLRYVDVITPNEGEAALLTGAGLSDPARPMAAVQKLQELGCGRAVITLGAEGCLVVENDLMSIPGYEVDAVDTTAAGDAFNGALAVALAEGRSIVDAARWATRAAAIAVTRPGAQPSLPTRAEIESFRG